MKTYVYFDSGTTNMRGYMLREDGALICSAKARLGSRDSAISGHNAVVVDGLHALYEELLSASGKCDSDVEDIYASGMVTSPYGIHEIPHVVAPVSVSEFVTHVQPYFEGTRFHRTVNLVPGLKTDGARLCDINNMRGEEIEAIGAIPEIRARFGDEPVGIVLPGSHTHTLLVRGEILEDALSNFTGELYSAIRKTTILAPVLEIDVDEYDAEMICMGVENLRKYGFTRALYLCHTMRLFDRETPLRRASYAEGVILGGLCQSLDQSCAERWKTLRRLVVVAEPSTAKLYCSLLRNCQTPLEISAVESNAEWIPALQGMRYILQVKREKEQACAKRC